ncbi:AraC family transcriptional regulator [Vibrio sp.]|uniref:AraC family transcriptional regulator n=1 Tax=Vibrio sp. TaxID=678 RepID=UPI003D0C48ED
MHYAIQHQVNVFPYLSISPRKRVFKYSLIRVMEGMMLFRLGKTEYAVEPGQAVWIPFDCLCSVTRFPGSKMQTVEISSRVSTPLPHQAGFVELDTLSLALMDKLASLAGSDSQNQPGICTQTPSYQHDLLKVLQAEVSQFTPALAQSHLTKVINRWSAGQSDDSLNREQLLVLTMREAIKRMQSGQRESDVIAALFNGQQQEYQLLKQLILG